MLEIGKNLNRDQSKKEIVNVGEIKTRKPGFENVMKRDLRMKE